MEKLQTLSFRGLKKLPVSIILLILTSISTWEICWKVILPHIAGRIDHETRILSGTIEPPYQYRILKPLIGKFLGYMVSFFTDNIRWQHAIAYAFLSCLTFLCVFTLFYIYLRKNFSETYSIIGIVLLQIVIPLSITGYYMKGDYITLLCYICSLILIQQDKTTFLPLLIFIGTLNREQCIFIVVWCFIYWIANKKLTRQKLLIGFTCLVAWLIAYFGIRLYFGFKPTQYTIGLHIENNTNPKNLMRFILPLWFVEVFGFIVLSLYTFKKSDWFLRLAFLSLILYCAIFFFFGNLWEFAKFLPAYLILIPMSLQAFPESRKEFGNMLPQTHESR
jgi:hypothetical protein